MDIFASFKSMLQVKMLEVIQNRFSGLLPNRHRIKLNLFSYVTYRILSWTEKVIKSGNDFEKILNSMYQTSGGARHGAPASGDKEDTEPLRRAAQCGNAPLRRTPWEGARRVPAVVG